MKATAVSKIISNKSPPKMKNLGNQPLETRGVLIKVINKWPATMLAANRTERVKGRIRFLTNSIKTIKGINT